VLPPTAPENAAKLFLFDDDDEVTRSPAWLFRAPKFTPPPKGFEFAEVPKTPIPGEAVVALKQKPLAGASGLGVGFPNVTPAPPKLGALATVEKPGPERKEEVLLTTGALNGDPNVELLFMALGREEPKGEDCID